jgi:hypothetical protein
VSESDREALTSRGLWPTRVCRTVKNNSRFVYKVVNKEILHREDLGHYHLCLASLMRILYTCKSYGRGDLSMPNVKK